MNDRFFFALAKVRLGRDAEVARDLDAVAPSWAGVAVKLTASAPLRVHPEQANYWVALDTLLGMCAARGLSVDCVIFGDDVKRIMPDPEHRRAFVVRVHEFLQGRPDVHIVLMDMTPNHAMPAPSIDPYYDADPGFLAASGVRVVWVLAAALAAALVIWRLLR